MQDINFNLYVLHRQFKSSERDGWPLVTTQASADYAFKDVHIDLKRFYEVMVYIRSKGLWVFDFYLVR